MRENTANSQNGGKGSAKGGPRQCNYEPSSGRLRSDLRRVIAAWPTLPADVKAAILALVERAGG
jgi:hypothetical protein